MTGKYDKCVKQWNNIFSNKLIECFVWLKSNVRFFRLKQILVCGRDTHVKNYLCLFFIKIWYNISKILNLWFSKSNLCKAK